MPLSPPAPDDMTRYRRAEVDVYRIGRGYVLLAAAGEQRNRVVCARVAEVFLQCDDFRTLDEHIQAHLGGLQLDSAGRRRLRVELRALADSGMLVSQQGVVDRLRAGRAARSLPITTVCFPTCDRVGELRRGLTSYLENSQRYGRRVAFTVADDSASPAIRAAYRQMLGRLRAEFGATVEYAGRDEKVAFVEKLASLGTVPKEVIRFALLGHQQGGLTTVGANRNALLLHTVGEAVLSADDDTVAKPSLAPHAGPGLAFSWQSNPLAVSFFKDERNLLAAATFADQDVLALHEAWLAQDPLTVMADGPPSSLPVPEPALLARLTSRPSRVAVTVAGTVGDCSWDNAAFALFQTGETLSRMTASADAYQTARASRQVAQAASQTTVADSANPMFAMCVGLDNSQLLPPFAPLGRAEELTFATLLSKCFRDTLAVYLPWAVLHLPPGTRAYPGYHTATIGFNAWLPALISTLDAGFTHAPAERLRNIGRHLRALGQLPREAFEAFVDDLRWRNLSALVEQLEARLEAGSELPAFYKTDVEALIRSLRQEAHVPTERLYLLPGGSAVLQQHLVDFGRVVSRWPDLVAAAHALREQGERLAQSV